MAEQYEGDENDVADIDALLRLRERRRPGPDDPLAEEFRAFFETLGARNFNADEFLVLGPSHAGSGPCGGKNSLPSKNLWANVVPLVAALDAIRDELNSSVIITNCYRNESYNACVGGVPGSEHRQFKAADFVGRAGTSADWAKAAQIVRRNGGFQGGIGIYKSFVHVDVRGRRADWDNR